MSPGPAALEDLLRDRNQPAALKEPATHNNTSGIRHPGASESVDRGKFHPILQVRTTGIISSRNFRTSRDWQGANLVPLSQAASSNLPQGFYILIN